jgi:hypothetical protein
MTPIPTMRSAVCGRSSRPRNLRRCLKLLDGFWAGKHLRFGCEQIFARIVTIERAFRGTRDERGKTFRLKINEFLTTLLSPSPIQSACRGYSNDHFSLARVDRTVIHARYQMALISLRTAFRSAKVEGPRLSTWPAAVMVEFPIGRSPNGRRWSPPLFERRTR